jgi:hypothetical protein
LEGVKIESCHRIFPSIVKLQFEHQADTGGYHLRLGNLGKSEITCFGIQLKLPARETGRVNLADISLHYDSPLIKTPNVLDANVLVDYTADKDLCSYADREVLDYFYQVNAQTMLGQATEMIRKGEMNGAATMLMKVRSITERIGNDNISREIDATVEQIKKNGNVNGEMFKTIISAGRHTVVIDKTANKG